VPTGFVASQPTMDTLTTDAELLGHLSDGEAIPDDFEHGCPRQTTMNVGLREGIPR
jgi:hypothetical protein